MDIRQIEFVDAVARHGNFTRAANELHVAQPAVSAAIRHLEDELGVRLFERTSRHVALTHAGEAFLVGARRVMAELSDLSDAMREFDQGTRGVLRTSWWHQADPQMVRYLSDYTIKNPGVEVSIVEWPTSESLAGLRRGELDLAMVALPDRIDLKAWATPSSDANGTPSWSRRITRWLRGIRSALAILPRSDSS